jgi:hypothetical protein
MRVNRPLICTGWFLALGLSACAATAQTVHGFTARLAGDVTDAGARPLSGVTVRLFVGGLPIASALTDSAGIFEVTFPVDPSSDESVIACAVAPRPDLVSEWAILQESARDRQAGLWSPCVPRVGLSRSSRWSARITDAAGVRERLARNGCLAGRTTGAGGPGE